MPSSTDNKSYVLEDTKHGTATIIDDDDVVAEAQHQSRSSSSRLVGTLEDEHDMRMLGRVQQLNRNFRFISTLGFACTLMSTWEIALMTSFFALLNGGIAGMVWGYLIVWMGYLLVFASIAEMASMSPTAGGQYHWVSEFAPPSTQRFVSYITGWVSVLGWQTGLASLSFLTGTMIQGLLVLNYPPTLAEDGVTVVSDGYVPAPWHGTLLVIGITAFCIVFNTFLAKRLPMVEGTVLIVHVLGFFAVLIPLWVLAPRSSPQQVFGEFLNLGGWDSAGTSFMVGLLAPVYTLIGADSAVHMAEEIRDASVVLPKAIMTAAGVNGSLGWAMVLTFAFTLGGSVEAVLFSPTHYPFIQVFYDVTRSRAGTAVMTSLLIVNITSACISTVATVSRQTWAFARDRGMPFSGFVGYVKPGWNIPLNAVVLTFIVTMLLSLINLGSAVAFQAIGSLAVSALLATYIISLSCLVLRRLRGPPLPARRWSLGRWGVFVNVGALMFLLVVWVFVFFPVAPNPTLDLMNWSSVMFGGTMIFSVVYYLVWGRKAYTSPVDLVKRGDD